MLSASEAPPVKTTSAASTPSAAAALARAASSPRRASRPAQCGSEALPKCSRRNGCIASQASSLTGVVAA